MIHGQKCGTNYGECLYHRNRYPYGTSRQWWGNYGATWIPSSTPDDQESFQVTPGDEGGRVGPRTRRRRGVRNGIGGVDEVLPLVAEEQQEGERPVE